MPIESHRQSKTLQDFYPATVKSQSPSTSELILQLGQFLWRRKQALYPLPRTVPIQIDEEEIEDGIRSSTSAILKKIKYKESDALRLRALLGFTNIDTSLPIAIKVVAVLSYGDLLEMGNIAAISLLKSVCRSENITDQLACRSVISKLCKRRIIAAEEPLSSVHPDNNPPLYSSRRLLRFVLGDKHDICIKSYTEKQIPKDEPVTTSQDSKIQKNDKLDSLTVNGISKKLSKHVLGVPEVVNQASAGMILHTKRLEQIRNGIRPNTPPPVTLIIGASGTGKNHLISSLGRCVSLPFQIEDASSVTEAGYAGNNACSPIRRALDTYEGDINEKINQLQVSGLSIAYNEFDKTAIRRINTRDISGEGAQNCLLTILEGSTVNLIRQGISDPPAVVNTSGFNFYLMGAFDGIQEILKKHINKRGKIGFASSDRNTVPAIHDILMEYGIIPQILNRITSYIYIPTPTVNTLKKICRLQIRYYNELLPINTLQLTSPAISSLATFAYESKTYSRGLKMVLNSALQNALIYRKTQSYEKKDIDYFIECNRPEKVLTAIS